MINESTMFDCMAIRTDESHVGERVVIPVPVLVMEPENLRMIAVPAPLASVHGDSTALIGSLESIRRHSEWSCESPAFATTKFRLICLTAAYLKLYSTLLAYSYFREFESFVSLLYLAIRRAVNLGPTTIYAWRKLLATYGASLLVEGNFPSVVSGVALVGTESSMPNAGAYNPKASPTLETFYVRPFPWAFILTSKRSSHKEILQILNCNVNTWRSYVSI